MDQFDPQEDNTPPPLRSENEESYKPSGPQVRPWVRFGARSIDCVFLFGSLATFILYAIDPSTLPLFDPQQSPGAQPTLSNFFFTPLILFAYVFVEAVMVTAWGTTPGKAFLKVRVRNSDGSRLDFGTALNRSWEIWIRGMGLGIPFVTWFIQLMAYARLKERGVTSWDEAGEYTVSHQIIGPTRCLLLATVVFLLLYGTLLIMKGGA